MVENRFKVAKLLKVVLFILAAPIILLISVFSNGPLEDLISEHVIIAFGDKLKMRTYTKKDFEKMTR